MKSCLIVIIKDRNQIIDFEIFELCYQDHNFYLDYTKIIVIVKIIVNVNRVLLSCNQFKATLNKAKWRQNKIVLSLSRECFALSCFSINNNLINNDIFIYQFSYLL